MLLILSDHDRTWAGEECEVVRGRLDDVLEATLIASGFQGIKQGARS